MKDSISKSLVNIKEHILKEENAYLEVKKPEISHNTRRLELVDKIEAVVLQLVSTIANKEPVELEYREASWENVDFSDRVELKEQIVSRKVKLNSKLSQPKLLLMIQLLEKAYQLLTSSSTATQRELYYQLLHSSKSTVSVAIRNVCSLLSCAPWELGILSTSKGIAAGPLTIDLFGEKVDFSIQGGTQIPSNMFEASNVKSDAKVVLLVEKDAIFQRLLDEELPDRFGQCILITGKGFPDMCTRQLLKLLWDSLHIPILALVDADPHGIEIMCVYRFGSLAMCDQAEALAVPAIRWLGIHPTDIARLDFPEENLAPLTQNDMNKAKDLQKRPYILNNPALKNEVDELIRIGKKAEIEAVGSFSQAYLTDVFIPTKINNLEVL